MEKGFRELLCIESDVPHIFKVGTIYANVGYNNGVHVLYDDAVLHGKTKGDPMDVTCHSYTGGFDSPVDGLGDDYNYDSSKVKFVEVDMNILDERHFSSALKDVINKRGFSFYPSFEYLEDGSRKFYSADVWEDCSLMLSYYKGDSHGAQTHIAIDDFTLWGSFDRFVEHAAKTLIDFYFEQECLFPIETAPF